MSISSAQIKSLPRAIADIYLPLSDNEPGSIADALRPLLLELRRSRMTGEPMRKDVLDRFCGSAAI